VTPYTVRVVCHALHNVCCVVEVDGVEVHGVALVPHNSSSTVKGFDTNDGVKEFLFSFPRYARDEYDRMDAARLRRLGTIVARFHPTDDGEQRMGYNHRTIADFTQGNKKDADVAGGNSLTSTTRPGSVVGQYVARHCPRPPSLACATAAVTRPYKGVGARGSAPIRRTACTRPTTLTGSWCCASSSCTTRCGTC
jgi:hypothetical protein